MAIFRVKQLAEEQGLNITALSERAKLSRPTVHALWHNHTMRIDIATLVAISKALGVRIGDLFIEEDEQLEERSNPKQPSRAAA